MDIITKFVIICENNAVNEISTYATVVVVDKVLSMKGAADGYDAENNTYCDLLKAGVVDPAKVVRTALENAASITGTVLLTEALVADAPEKEGAHAPAMPGMGGMGGMM